LTRWQRLARAALAAAGWRLVGEAPEVSHCVIIFAPHTSNWDFPLLLCVRAAFGRPVAYLIKDTLFRFPIAGLLRWTGAIPVERSERHSLVSTLAQAFRQRPFLWLAMSPEGTRAWTDHWRSGFYHVAREAQVPLVPSFIDAERRECGLMPLFELTCDIDRDMAALRSLYAHKRGIQPGREGEIRLLEEADSERGGPPKSG
jgi:1-acyl-sn-glycerol-3-phosphate acyltransferase